MEAASGSGELAAVPSLVLEAIWSQLSFAARCNLRATCRALRQRIDSELIRAVVVISRGRGSGASCQGEALVPSLSIRQSQLPPEVLHVLVSVSRGAGRTCHHLGLMPSEPPDSDPSAVIAHPAVPGGVLPRSSPVPSPATATSTATPARAVSTTAAAYNAPGAGRFQSLRALVLTPQGLGGGALTGALPATLQPFLTPPPASLLAPFAACAASLSHLVLMDPMPGPSERDIAAIAASFPALGSLQLLASPGRGARTAVPPLDALRACTQLRRLGLDLGRSSVMGARSRASLGLLTQLTHLMLGLADTGGDEVEAAAEAHGPCTCGGSLTSNHHHHHLHRTACTPSLAVSACCTQPKAGDEGRPCGAAGGPCVVAAMVGGVEASLYKLAGANLKALELRVISFGSYHRRLLQAVAAGGAAAGTATAMATHGGSAASGDCSGLEHLCLRLMPSPMHAAATSASFVVGGSAGFGGAFGGGGLGGELGTPSASLSFGPLPLGDAAASPAAAVGWVQPSESELILAALPIFPGLERLEVPELLLTSSNQLTCLSALTRLRQLRVGGVVAAGISVKAVPPAGTGRRRSGAAALAGLQSLVVEAESPVYGGPAAVPWWAVVCPSLRSLSLTLQFGDAHRAALGGGWHDSQLATEQLAASLARVPEVRLVVCLAGRTVSSSAASHIGGYGVARRSGGDSRSGATHTLRKDLPAIVRLAGTVQHLELYASDAAELLSCLSDDLLALVPQEGLPPASAAVTPAADGDFADGYGARARELDGCPSDSKSARLPGVETLRLVAFASLDSIAVKVVPLFCKIAAGMLERAFPALGCICLSVPGLWAAAGNGSGPRWWACAGREAAGAKVFCPVEALARAAAARGTRLCLCSLESEERATLLYCLERGGVHIAEGRCRGCVLDGPVHAVV